MILALDIGSSSVKAALLQDQRLVGDVAAVNFPTHRADDRAEVAPPELLKAIVRAIVQVGPAARTVDAIALSTMAPSWIAMDRRGQPLTPIVTHQDRRSIEQARAIEQRLGKQRHLRLAGNRPFPGGISSTTFAWFKQHHPALIRRADLVGHLTTLLHRQWTGQRVTDPSNASFMGLYRTLKQDDWCDELIQAAGASRHQLPDVLPANQVAGRLTSTAARALGLSAGTPLLAGIMDGSAGMLLAGATPGQLFHVSGSTDVLALCTDRPLPDERLLTRALGVGRLWTAVSTLAAAGSSIQWAKQQFFPDYDWPGFNRLIARLSKERRDSNVSFRPYLAGDRMSIEQPQGAFEHLTLATTRLDMLAAILESLIAASAQRLTLLQKQKVPLNNTVATSLSARSGLERLLCRDWPGQWRFRTLRQSTLRGLGKLRPFDPATQDRSSRT
jgi:xylulokinase